jgi:hypothetical protein
MTAWTTSAVTMAGMVAAAVAGADYPHIHPAPPFPIPTPPSLFYFIIL